MRYVVDIDQTLLYSKFNEKTNKYEITGTNDDLIVKINELHRQGNEIILWTGRHWNHLKLTKHQLDFFCIRYTTLIMGKPVADQYYIDDKAITPEDFLKLEEVEEKDTCDNKYQFGHIDTHEIKMLIDEYLEGLKNCNMYESAIDKARCTLNDFYNTKIKGK